MNQFVRNVNIWYPKIDLPEHLSAFLVNLCPLGIQILQNSPVLLTHISLPSKRISYQTRKIVPLLGFFSWITLPAGL